MTRSESETEREAAETAGGLRRELGLLLYAVQFLTRLPVPGWVGHAPDRLGRSLRWFPLVGALVGLAGGAVYALAALALPPLAAAGLALALTLALTGALHEDGLSDTLDGLGGGATRERALEIMRDSRIGAYGAAGLVLSLLIRAAALAALGPLAGLAALVAAHAAGRAAIAGAIRFSGYARERGAASGVADGPPAGAWPAALALAAAICAATAGLAGIAALGLGLAAGGWMLLRLVRRLGGYTGDGLGAVEQAAEIAALLALAAWLG
jgi:adenosylcobinamide-GDP ribazoletransferase